MYVFHLRFTEKEIEIVDVPRICALLCGVHHQSLGEWVNTAMYIITYSSIRNMYLLLICFVPLLLVLL